MTTINKITVHAVRKEQHKDPLDNDIRDDLIDSKHEAAAKLLESVSKMYGSKAGSANFGVFAEAGKGGRFPEPAQEYLIDHDPSDESFQALTIVAMDELVRLARQQPLATGGYILFADYNTGGGRYFVVVMFKQKPSFRIQDLIPEELMTLDTSKIYQAARISFSKFSDFENASDEEKRHLQYLSFVSPKNERPASGYFVEALGCVSGSSAKQATDALINESVAHLNSIDELKPHCRVFHNALMDYLNDKVSDNEPVELSEVGEIYRKFIPPNKADEADDWVDAFVTKLNSEEVGVPDQFVPNRLVVKNNTRIKAEGSGWKAEIDRQKLGNDPAAVVYYDEESKSITLRGLSDKMIQEIEEILELNDEDE